MRIILTSFLLIFSTIIFAQETTGIKFFKGTWSDVQTEAKAKHKNIFLDIYATWCKPCKEMEKTVFVNAQVGEEFNKNFINYQLDAEEGEGVSVAQKYVIDVYPMYLFLSDEGEIIYRSAGSMSAEKFIIEAQKALKIAKNDKPLSVLEKEYQAGKRESSFLKEYLEKKVQAGGDNSALLDEYLATISEGEYQTEKVLTLISDSGTTIGSKAFEILLTANKRRTRLTPQQNRAVMLGISKAERKAIKKAMDTKDERLLEKTIEVSRQTSFNPNNALAEERQIRMKFAKATNNFDAYQKLAVPYATDLMAKTKEQLQIETQKGIEMMKKNAQFQRRDTTSQEFKAMLFAMENGATKATAYQLNELAWGYIELVQESESGSTETLDEAIKWSERAIELEETPANLDTYANLLFKIGKQKEAIKKQKEAIKLAKKMGGNTDELEETLKKMRN